MTNERQKITKADRIARRLDPRLSPWIDIEDVKQDLALNRLSNPGGRTAVNVERTYRDLARLNEYPAPFDAPHERPTEAAAFRRMFWLDIFRKIREPFFEKGVEVAPPYSFRAFKILWRLYVRRDSTSQIGDMYGVSRVRISQIDIDARKRFKRPRGGYRIQDYKESDFR